MIEQTTLIWAGIAAVFGAALPLSAAIVWCKKRRVRVLPLFVGALTWIVFSQGLESILHYFCLFSDNAISRTIRASDVLYMLYGAFAAGIFEETGRLFAFKAPLRRCHRRDEAVAYGIGHGGIEAFLLLGLPMALTLAAGILMNVGDAASLAALTGGADEEALALLSDCTPTNCLLAMIERVSAMLVQISLSVFVFIAARAGGKKRYFFAAILLHALFDMPSALYQRGVLSLGMTELILFTASVLLAAAARKGYLEQADA